jgi:Flp pilus assembly protein CpaB
MRASTLFALTVAVLIGLGVAVAAKMAGFFNGTPVETPAKKQEIQVLAAARNLFAGDMIDASGVHLRALKPEELANYQKNRDQYLPASVAAATFRMAKRNIYAEEPITKDCLLDMVKPTKITERISPNMRAVNLSLSKERSAGGLIETGAWVDVFLTSTITSPKGVATTRTVVLVPKARVIAKRNSLWQIFAPLPDNKPVNYTLEVNPYRAALLDFVRNKGILTMAPIAPEKDNKLEAKREAILNDRGPVRPVNFVAADKTEDDDEAKRVEAYNRGDLVVSEADMLRIFGVTTSPPPAAGKPPIQVEQWTGLNQRSPATFGETGRSASSVAMPNYLIDRSAAPAVAAALSQAQAYGAQPNYAFGSNKLTFGNATYQFSDPGDSCPSCKKSADYR